MRRIKSVSVTIPCVTGPYTSVNCTLTLLKSKIRFDPSSAPDYGEQDTDARFIYRFAATQSIATSTAENDSGMFEVSFRDERYLPFEGEGAVSQWRIELPVENNAFDFMTITDIIMSVSFTARDRGVSLNKAAKKYLAANPTQDGERFFSVKHEFPDAWYGFLNPKDPSSAQSMTLNLTQDRFPFLLRGKTLSFNTVTIFLVLKTIFDKTTYTLDAKNPTPLGDYGKSQLGLTVAPAGASGSQSISLTGTDTVLAGLALGNADLSSGPGSVGPWQIAVDPASLASLPKSLVVAGSGPSEVSRLRPDVVDDIWIVTRYSVA